MTRSATVPVALLATGAGASVAALAVRGWAAGLRARHRTATALGGAGPRRLVRSRGRPVEGPGTTTARRAQRPVIAVGAGLLAALVVGGGAGAVAGTLLAGALYRWLPRPRSPAERRAALEEDRIARQLPLAAELLSACLGSAGSPAQAVAAVGRSLAAPMGPRLIALSAELALGAPPEVCWGRLGAQSPVLAPLARCLVRTSLSGAPAAVALAGLAHGQRAAAARAAHARVRRAGVLATAPLGLCFLPAFVLISVVPVVIGLAGAFGDRS